MHSKNKLATLVCAAAASLAAGGTQAAGFQLLEQNASGLANAYAGSAAVAENASTIYFNAAGLTELPGRTLTGGVNVIRVSYTFNDEGSTGVSGGGSGGDAGGYAGVPNGYVSWQVSPEVFLGFGVNAPFGLKTEYSEGWVGAAQATLFDLVSINLNPTIAYKLDDKWSLGFGLDIQRFEAEYERQATVIPSGVFSDQVRFKADGTAYSWNAGVLFKPTSTTKLGLSYRAKVRHRLEGDLSTSRSLDALANVNGDAFADVVLPDTIIFSVAQKLDDRWEMLGDVSWTGWSSIQDVKIKYAGGGRRGTVAQTLVTNFDDSFRVALGSNYKLDDSWKLKFGVAFDQTPVPNKQDRLVSLPDNDRYWLSGGAQYRLNANSTLDFGIAWLYIEDTDIDNNQGALQGRVTGNYDGKVFIGGVQYALNF